MKRSIILVTVFTAALLSGCGSPRGLGHSVTRPDDPYSNSPIEQTSANVGEQLSSLPIGTTTIVDLPNGRYEVTVEKAYKSALGESCKRILIKTGLRFSQKAAVCKNSRGGWRYLPPLNSF